MRVHSLGRGFLLLFLVISFCNADEQTFEVVGLGECADCKENSFKTSEAFTGLHVTIDCKLKTGEIKRIGVGETDEAGEFRISLPQEIIQDGKNLKEECYAQLHSAAAIPCPAHNGLEATKIIFKSQTNDKYTFTPTKNLEFSAALCTSKLLWPYFKYPPLPKTHPWKKSWPKISFPPLKNWTPLYKTKPLPPSIPIYKPPVVKPLPPPAPIYKPKPKPPAVVKPLPPPVPIYKPKPKPPAVVKPLPPPVPIYKPKPKPPVVKPLPPTYKPKPPVYIKPKPPVYEPPKKPLPPPAPQVYKPKPNFPVKPLPPPVPIYKPVPVLTKPLPPPFPLYPIPPFYKKPCPPLPKIPPKYINHPKFGLFPPLPPFFPNP